LVILRLGYLLGIENKPDYEQPAAGQAGMTDLHAAAWSGDLDAALAAIAAGADVNARDHGDWTPLHWVVDMGMVDGDREALVSVLAQAGADLNARSLDGATPLMIACRSGNGDLVRQLLSMGADLHLRSRDGSTALMEAAGYGDPDTVRFLLESGANRADRKADGRTALDVARDQGWDEIVKLLST
jgi:ankyrin repeat protein